MASHHRGFLCLAIVSSSALLACGRTLAPAPAPALGLDASWARAGESMSCARTCSRGSALSFVSAAGTSSLCAFGDSVGFETSAQPGVCQAGAASSSGGHFCKCLAKDQLPGLALPRPEDPTCDTSCSQAMTGVTGTGVGLTAGSGQRVCIAHDDVGSTNRFTSTVAGSANTPVTCQAGPATLSGANFSCVCQYTLAPAPAVAVQGDPRVAAQSLATLG